jgi:hypothetical protein
MDDEKREMLERAYRAIESVDAAQAEWEQRRVERALSGESEWRVPEPPPLVHPVRRPPRAGRDWHSEETWIRSITGGEISKLRQEIAGGTGQALARMRAEMQGEFRRELEDLRLEVKKLATEGIVATMDARLARLDALADKMEGHLDAELILPPVKPRVARH